MSYNHQIIDKTDVVTVDPMSLRWISEKRSGLSWLRKLFKRPKNFINGPLFIYEGVKIIGWVISEGRVINERHEPKSWGNPKGTLIVFRDGTVFAGWKYDWEMEQIKDKIWFCCQGFNLYPPGMTVWQGIKEEGFDPKDVGYSTERLAIGYNPATKKVVIAVRPDSDAARAVKTMDNLGCHGSAICLDSGGSVNLVVGGNRRYATARVLPGIITWE